MCTIKRTICIILTAILLFSCCGTALADGERVLTSADDWTVITLDPGHGGSGGGAYKYNGTWLTETECVLKIAYYLKAELETYDHVRVVLTRQTNSEEDYRPIYEIVDRINIGEAHCNDIFVSLHLNGVDRHNAKGTCVIVPRLGTYRPELAAESRALGQCILSELTALGLSPYNGGLMTRASEDNTRYPDGSLADYYGVVGGGMRRNFVSVLIEHCFIDNLAEASEFLFTDSGLQRLAHADCEGIVNYLGLQKATPEQLAETANQYFLTDYRWNWAKKNIDRAIFEGWVKGYNDDTFRPTRTVTRGEFVTFLGRASGVENVCEEAPFPDVPAGKFCAAYVKWASDNGIVAGFNENEFRPDALITREQIAKIMACYLRYLGCDISYSFWLEEYDIADVDSIGAWSRPYVSFCYEKGLLQGTSAGTFAPKRSATRAEACAVLVRMMDYAAENAPDPVEPEEPPVVSSAVIAEDGDKCDREELTIIRSIIIDEGAQSVILSAREPVTDVKLYTRIMAEDGSFERIPLWECGGMNINEAVEVISFIPDVFPLVYIDYTMPDGTVVTRGIFQSGENGEILLVEN